MSDSEINRCPTTTLITRPLCSWNYSRTDGVPATCPACAHSKGLPEWERVMQINSDLKVKQ